MNREKDITRKVEVAANKNVKERDYWLAQLSGELVKSHVYYDYNDHRGHPGEERTMDRVVIEIPPDLYGNLNKLSGGSPHKLHMVLAAGLVFLLHKYTGNSDIIIGTPIYKQEIEGEFVNTALALRNAVTDDMTFKELLLSVRQTIFGAVENQNYPIESLVYQLKLPVAEGKFPLFDTVVLLENIHDKCYLQHVHPRMSFIFSERPGRMVGTIEYNPGYYKHSTIAQAANHYISLLGHALSDVNRRLCDIDIFPEAEKNKLVKELDHTAVTWPYDKTITQLFEEQVEKFPGKTAVVFRDEMVTYRELDEKANRIANYLYLEKQTRADHRVGLLMDKSGDCIAAILGILKAGGGYVPIDPGLPGERMAEMIDDADIEVLISEKKYIKTLNRLQWQCSRLHTFLCLDSRAVDDEEEEESALMDRKLWEYVGESAVDDITGGGWKSSYTGLAISNEEMAEYGRNALEKVTPFLHPKCRVLEIGCATGLTMYLVAPKVGFYYGTDLSPVIIDRNRERVEKEGYTHIKLECLPAHEIHKIEEKNFDLIILNSVIQHFSGHNYLRKIIARAIQLLGPQGAIFIGDIMDLEQKNALINELSEFKKNNVDKNYRTKTDWSEELFISKSFFQDLEAEIPAIRTVEFSAKIRTIENELTKFRYDTLITVDKRMEFRDTVRKQWKYREDRRAVEKHSCRKPGGRVKPHDLLYIIYTSGTTGKPKGAVIEHRNVVRLFVNDSNLFDFNDSDVWSMFHAYNFDFSVWEMYGALLHGGKLIVIPRETARDTGEFLRILAEQHVTVLNQTPAAFYRLMEEEADGPGRELKLRYLIFGGEALAPAKLKNWQHEYPHLKIINMYGITETTVHVTYKNIGLAEIENDSRSIGSPIPTLNALVLNRNFQLLPVGAPGELYVGGAGVARGYLNRPTLTAEKFIHLHHLSFISHHSKLYRTGDLARVLAGGELEYLGRIDQQVKIRGFRIELGEIESHIRKHEAIKDAAVIVRDDGYGDRYLCAYVVREKNDDTAELKEYLAKKVPEYMIPLHFVPVEKIPLTPNGKLDQKALPEPAAAGLGDDYIAPRDESEAKMAEIWADILHVDKGKISMDSNFFELGGHSLKATILIANIHKAFNVKVPLAEIFKTPTIGELSAYIKGKGMSGEQHTSIEPVEEREYYVLSSAQKRIYFLHQFDLSGIGYNMPWILPLGKEVEKDKLESILRRLIDRYESLRTSFERVNEEVVQRIQKAGNIEFSLDYYEAGKTGLGKIIKDYIKPFDLSRAPLIRSGLIRLPDDNCIWIVDLHHIVSDGTSHTILTEDFMAEYSGKELKPLHIQYKDFALWQQRRFENGEIKAQLEYWLDLFAGEIPRLNLPVDNERPPVFTFAGDSYRFILSGEETKKFKGLGARGGGTLYLNMLAALNVLFYKYTGQSDIIIGSGIAGRRHVDLQGVVGMFINTLAMRNYPQGEKPYESFLKEVITASVRGFENQDVQFEDLVDNLDLERDASRNPVFDIMMMVQNFRRVGENGRATSTGYAAMPPMGTLPAANENPAAGEYKLTTSKLDMTFYVNEHGDDISIYIEYYSSIFNPGTIQRLASHLKNVIKSVVADTSIKLKDIEIISDDEKKKIIYEFNDTERPYPDAKTIHQLFAERASRTPDHISLVGADLRVCPTLSTRPVYLTYRQLNERSGLLAELLIKKGVQPDMVVGIMVERSVEMIIGIMGILKSGGAYLPIDPGYPRERIDFMLKDSGAKLLLTANEISSLSTGSVFNLHHSSFIIHHSRYLAYIIYTSGSTGKSKGVAIAHRSVVNFIKGITDVIPFTANDRILSLTTISFDIFGLEALVPLVSGAAVVMGSREEQLNPEAAGIVIERENISIFQVTPSRLQMIISTPGAAVTLKILKFLLVGGEAFPGLLLEKVRALVTGKIFNMYGPTETTIWSTVKEVSAGGESLNIGKPIANTTIHILDDTYHPVPIAVPGELCIGGDGLARGYLNRPELTAEKFGLQITNKSFGKSRNPFSKGFLAAGGIFYRTGDLARWLPDGNIEFLGRADGQVKIRGYRIELGEIENSLLKYDKIKETVVLVSESAAGDKGIIAYIVTETGYSEDKLRSFLSNVLPEYMIPLFFVCLEKLPLTPNGKIDRKALPDPWSNIEKAGEIVPQDELELKLASIWSEVLHIPIEKIGMGSNFFQLGGHSLNAMYLISTIHKALNIKIPLVQVFKKPSLGGILEIIRHEIHIDYSGIEAVEEREYYGLSSAQSRLYFLQQIAPESISYNMPVVYPLGKEISKEKLKDAMNRLICRHDSLRTSFVRVNDVLVQRVYREIDLNMEYYETSGISGDEGKEISGLIKTFIRPFDLSAAPLIRSGLIRTQNGYHIWIVDTHHIVSDGTSAMILTQDFLDLYNGRHLAPLQLQYKDYSYWQNRLFAGGEVLVQEAYWLSMFSGDIPRLEMPMDYKRPDVFTFAGDRFAFRLDLPDAVQFRALGIQNSATLYMNILAALSVLLYRYTGQEDVIIGSAIAGRPHADLQHIIGMFVNTLAMRNYPAGEKTYSAFLSEVATNSIKAFENQDVQFEALLEKLNPERDTSRNPLFDISMVVQNFNRPGNENITSAARRSQESDTFPTFEYRNTSARFDMTFFVMEQGEEVLIDIEYYTGIFKCETIQRLASHFKNVIKSAIANPAVKLQDIEIVSAAEKERLVNDLNNTAVEYPVDKTVTHLIGEQVERTPDRIALIGPYAGEDPHSLLHLSYRKLAEGANQVANYLHFGKNSQPEEPVGILMDKSIQTIIAMVGILNSGGVYVPIDPVYPEQRIKTIIDDASITVLITEKKFLKTINRLQWECPGLNTFLCLDTRDVANEEEEESVLMDRKLWEYVGESAVDDITGGGWKSSYTGLAIPDEEMAEYAQNALEKVSPYLHQNCRVLEIGCATGLTMYLVAPKVGFYYGTDLSPVIIERNRERVEKEGYANIKLECLPAHEIHNIEENNFDIIILNSVIQHFSGHNYLRKVIEKALRLMAPQGVIFIGDIMDLEMKDALIKDLSEFKKANQGKNYRTKTDWSEELFLSKNFFQDMGADIPAVQSVEFSDKIRTIENELTKFRYDTLITVNKNLELQNKGKKKYKYREDVRALSKHLDSKPGIRVEPHYLLYMIYTSGTTGKPKGVMIEHRNIVRLLVNDRNLFDFNSNDVWTMFHSYNFDFSVWEMYGALLCGGKLVIVPRVMARDTSAFLELVIREAVTVLNQTPTAFYRLMEEETDRPARELKLRYLIFGGEALVPSKLKSWQQEYAATKIINMYGITETTVHVTFKEIGKAEIENDSRSIGNPIPTLNAVVLDRNFNILPLGVPGELYVGGAGVTRGYLNSPALTAEKFINLHHSSFIIHHSKLYRTGDLVRVLGGGELEYLGRIDSQVKIRGFRIEIMEVESCLRAIESIKDATVITRTDEYGDNYLTAYFVPGKAFDTSELRNILSRSLPYYMIPSYLVPLETIPLTPNGKLDRKALPWSEGESSDREIEKYAAPRDQIEEKLVGIWNEVLGRSGRIGIDDDFFELGGHSLKATTLVSKMHKIFDVKVPLVQIFKTPNIRELAKYIKGIGKDCYISVAPAEEKEYYLLSSAQKRLYILYKMSPDSTAYNMPGIIPLSLEFNWKKIEETFKKLVNRHESLRTSFSMVNDTPVQRVHNEVKFELELQDCNHLQDFLKWFVRPFDLAKAPLIRAALIKEGAKRHILIVDMPHIISDGISYRVLERDFRLLYSGGHLPPLRVQYKDYSEWQNSPAQKDAISKQKDYWLREFSGVLPRLNLPIDYPRKEIRSFEGQTIPFILGKEETMALKELALKEGFTLFFLQVCIFNIFLYKITGQEDIIVGATAAGRKHADLENIIGMFVNTIALRNFPAGEKRFSEFAHEVKTRTFAAFENEDYQFEDVVNLLGIKKSADRNPLFDVAFSFLQRDERREEKATGKPADLPDENYRYNSTSSRFDLSLYGENTGNEILFRFEYCSELFRKEKIERFIKYFLEIISQVLKNKYIKLCDIDISHELIAADKHFLNETSDYDEF